MRSGKQEKERVARDHRRIPQRILTIHAMVLIAVGLLTPLSLGCSHPTYIISGNSGTVQDTFFALASDAEERGDYKAAADIYSEIIRKYPTSAQAYNNRGVANETMGRIVPALEDYRRAIELAPNSPVSYACSAQLFAKVGAYDLAADDFERAVQVGPDYAPAWGGYGWMLATATDPKVRDGHRAIRYATKACELSAWKDPISMYVLAAAHAEAGQFDDAIAWQKKSIGQPGLSMEQLSKARELLMQYQQGKPYRDIPIRTTE